MLDHQSGKKDISNNLADFTVHQLTIFRTVAEQLSYTKAAEILYLSQPAVTQQVRSLEQLLGLRLFVRSGRGIILTAAGQELMHHSEKLLALLAQTAPIVEDIHSLRRGSIIIGASTSAGTYVAPALLGAFHKRYPNVRITLTVANRHTIEEQLLARKVDLAIISMIEHKEHFTVEPLMPYELVVIAEPSHHLAGHYSISMAELQSETLLLREKGAATRQDTEHYFLEAGIPFHYEIELSSIEAIKEGVAAGLGIAVLSHESVALEVANHDLVILNIQGFPLKRWWYLVRLKERRLSLAATALRRHLLQQTKKNVSKQ